ncbi:hypothetical protein C0995_009476, partial [Termitomyces sp. Mi166
AAPTAISSLRVHEQRRSWTRVHVAIPIIHIFYSLFHRSSTLSTRTQQSDAYCHQSDVGKERLYFATGYGLIQCMKGLMSYADEVCARLVVLTRGWLLMTPTTTCRTCSLRINYTKHGNHIASQHRKKAGFLGTLMGSASSTAFIRSMTDVERLAELTYTESLFEKALLGIVYSGDWLAFIKEAYSTCAPSLASTATVVHISMKQMQPTPLPSPPQHPTPPLAPTSAQASTSASASATKLATLVELFRYKGDRAYGLKLLMRAGGWEDGEHATGDPSTSTQTEGVRRPLCDMALLIFHLVVSSYTGVSVDIRIATRILEWNLKRFPNSVFFLFGAGRLALHTSQPRLAISFYTRAMKSQIQYRNLDHVSYWECAIARLALWEVGEEVGVPSEKGEGEGEGERKEVRVGGSAACWRVLEAEATWSKSIYSYGLASLGPMHVVPPPLSSHHERRTKSGDGSDNEADDDEEIKREIFEDNDDDIEDNWVDPSVPTPISFGPPSIHLSPVTAALTVPIMVHANANENPKMHEKS